MSNLEIIKEVRRITGAGIVDVKESLKTAEGDKENAIEILRKAGTKIAVQKAERSTKEGLLTYTIEGNKIAIIALNCETDFVARNEDFKATAQDLVKELLKKGQEGFKEYAENKIKDELIVKIGENLQLGNFDILEGQTIGIYLHVNNKLASVIVLEGGYEKLAKDIAMHATALAPRYLTPEDIPSEVIEKEKEIYREQLKKEGKSNDIIEKILEGKITKFYKEVCLLKQNFVKDEQKTITELLIEQKAQIKEYKYFSL